MAKVPVRRPVPAEAPAAEEDASDGLIAYWRILWTHKSALFACAVGGALLGVLVVLPQTPVYRGRVSLEMQTLNEDFMNRRAVDPTADNYSADSYMQTQIKLLQSQSLTERVIRKMQSDGLRTANYEPGLASRLRIALRLSPQPGGEEAAEAALTTAAESVVVRGSGMTRVVEVYCDSTDPKVAADFANLLASEFIQNSLDVRLDLSKQTSQQLVQQLREAKARFERSEGLLLETARQLGLELVGEDEKLAQGELQHIQNELLAAQADRIRAEARHQLADSSPVEALPEVLDDAALRDYRARLSELRRQMAELTASVTAAHPKVLRLEPQISALTASMDAERANILTRIRNDYEAAARREAMLRKTYMQRTASISGQAIKGIHYRIAKREVDTNRQIYDTMLQKVKEVEVAAVMHSRNARVIDYAEPPKVPVKPNPRLAGAVGGIMGGFVGVLGIVMRERSRQRYIRPGDLATQVRQLAVIPAAESLPQAPWGRRRIRPFGAAGKDGVVEDGQLEPAESRVHLAASFQFALTSILLARGGNGGKVFVITSPAAGTGRTFSSLQLSLACLRVGRRVLLVDGDFQNPEIHTVFGLPNSEGLCQVLAGDAAVEDTIRTVPARVSGLHVLVSGHVPTLVSPLLFSPRITELVRWFRSEFDIILIDSPPILQSAEARLLARQADGTIMVLRVGRTPRDLARAALQQLEEDGVPALGTIVNDWKPVAS